MSESKKPTTSSPEEKKNPTFTETLVKGFREAANDKKKEYLAGIEKTVGDSEVLDAEKNNATCEFLAAVYSSGVKEFKIDPSEEKVKKYLNEGCKSGSTSCMISLGDIVAGNEPGRSKSLLEAALSAKDWRAANSLGVLAMRQNNITEALSKFELAESHNVAQAANNLCITRLQKCQQLLGESATILRSAMNQFATRSAPPAAPSKPAAEKTEEPAKDDSEEK